MNRLSADADFVSNKCVQVDDLSWKSRSKSEMRDTGCDQAWETAGSTHAAAKQKAACAAFCSCLKHVCNQQVRLYQQATKSQISADAP
jgi:hypothetical protein